MGIHTEGDLGGIQVEYPSTWVATRRGVYTGGYPHSGGLPRGSNSVSSYTAPVKPSEKYGSKNQTPASHHNTNKKR